jgi:hypothetical protein
MWWVNFYEGVHGDGDSVEGVDNVEMDRAETKQWG